jgi:hypothetical protein
MGWALGRLLRRDGDTVSMTSAINGSGGALAAVGAQDAHCDGSAVRCDILSRMAGHGRCLLNEWE